MKKSMIDSDVFLKLYLGCDEPSENDQTQWQWLHWLNSPGPVFTGYTDNMGMWEKHTIGYLAPDYNYREAVFRQPVTSDDLIVLEKIAKENPFDGYSFCGSHFWTLDLIRLWWSFSKDISEHIKMLMEREYSYGPGDPHLSTWNLRGEIKELHLYGPTRAIPEHFISWLDFYESGQLENQIRRFHYFLDNGKQAGDDELLPSLNNIKLEKISPEMIEKGRLFI